MKERRYQPFTPASKAKLKDWRSRPGQERTPAQQAATERNMRIMRMRSLWWCAAILSTDARLKVREIIDADLKAIGARTTQEQNAKVLREHNLDEEIPF